METYLPNKVDTVKLQSSLAWEITNEFLVENVSQAKLKAISQQDGLKKWKNYFQELLCKATALTNDDEILLLYGFDQPIIKTGGHTVYRIKTEQRPKEDTK